jgi:oligopeptide transport system substrate-binding protein
LDTRPPQARRRASGSSPRRLALAAFLVVGLGLVASLTLARSAPSPADGGGDRVLRMAITQDPPQLDSTKATDTVSSFVLGHVQEGLVRLGRHAEPMPGVAESWELRPMGATFRLRANARWSDGKPVTAHDFVFAWRKVVEPANASEYAFLVYPVKNAEAVNRGKLPPSALGVRARDERTLEVEFEKPCEYFLGAVAFRTFLPVREDFYAARAGRYAASPEDALSNGPFVLTRWVHGASLTLERNPLYWDAGRIRLDRIEIPYITSDQNARFNLFKDGKVDLIERLSRDELKRTQVERFRMKSFADGSVFFLEFNFREGRPTRSWHLRKAIQLALDGNEFVSRVVGIPGTRPGLALVPHWMPAGEGTFRKRYPVEPVKQDLDEARRHAELARAELGGAIPPLDWLTGDTPLAAREAEYFQRVLWTRLGIELRIDKQIFKQRLAKMTAGRFDVVSAGWGPDYRDPMTYADLFTSWNENNRGRYRNDRYDAHIRRAQATTDAEERLDEMAAAERIALEQLAFLPLYERATVWVHSRRVDGIVRRQLSPDPDLSWATAAPEEPPRPWSAMR